MQLVLQVIRGDSFPRFPEQHARSLGVVKRVLERVDECFYNWGTTVITSCYHKTFANLICSFISLLREAIALAKVRLSPLDPELFDLYSTWARKLETDNSFEQAAKW